MQKLIYGFFLSAVFSMTAHALPLPKGPRNLVALPPTFTANYNFEGIVALDNCSGSIVRLESSTDSDQAMVLTNGHCNEGGFLNPGEYLINKSSNRTFAVLDPSGDEIGTAHATSIIYATMTKTDMTL